MAQTTRYSLGGNVSNLMIKQWTISHFSQSNPAGADQGNVAALLRRVADSIEGLGDITIEGITFHAEPTADEDDLTMTVYYHSKPRRRASAS